MVQCRHQPAARPIPCLLRLKRLYHAVRSGEVHPWLYPKPRSAQYDHPVSLHWSLFETVSASPLFSIIAFDLQTQPMDDTTDAPPSPEGTVVSSKGRQAQNDAQIIRQLLAQIESSGDWSSPASRRTLLALLPALLSLQGHHPLVWLGALANAILLLRDTAWDPIAQTLRSSAQFASNYRIRDIYMSRRQQEACTLPSSINGNFFANMSTASSVA